MCVHCKAIKVVAVGNTYAYSLARSIKVHFAASSGVKNRNYCFTDMYSNLTWQVIYSRYIQRVNPLISFEQQSKLLVHLFLVS